MTKELKSAFKIPGFLEGETKIQHRETKEIYFWEGDELFYCCSDNEKKLQKLMHVEYFASKVWYPVEEKKKYWEHTYLEGNFNQQWCLERKVLISNEDWEETKKVMGSESRGGNSWDAYTLLESKEVEL